MINFITNLDPFNKGVLMIATPLILFYFWLKISEKILDKEDAEKAMKKSKC